jgi:1-acyl-sn-glycerol-3-phosphate acyltransferase
MPDHRSPSAPNPFPGFMKSGQRQSMSYSLKTRVWLQYLMGRCVIFFTAPLIYLLIWCMGYRVEELKRVRKTVMRLYRKHPGPWLIYANHLTLVDSVLIAYALAPFYRYMVHYMRLPWNMPEKTNFNTNVVLNLTTFVFKCIPVIRGGNRKTIAETLAKCAFILENRESLLIFPEGTRSRSGRIDPEHFSYGVGGLYQKIPNCKVLCVYLRGEKQTVFSDFPQRKQVFYADVRHLTPKGIGKGLRGQRECARQIIHTLIDMEKRYDDTVGK